MDEDGLNPDVWEYAEDGAYYFGAEYQPGGTVRFLAAGYDNIPVEITMPYEEFKHLADVMHERRLAERVTERTLPPDTRLVREVLALSGMGPGELAGLLIAASVNSVRNWHEGARVPTLTRERLQHILEQLKGMEFDPHAGRRAAFFSYQNGQPSLYFRLQQQRPYREPIQSSGYTPDQLLGARHD